MPNVQIKRSPREISTHSLISNQLLFDPNLDGDSIRLLSCILNETTDNLVLYRYSEMFNWSEYMQARVVRNLELHGYLRKKKTSKGRSRFEYEYEICEKGSLLDSNS